MLLLKRLELLSKVLDEKFDKEWWIKFYQKKRDYPKHHLNHELQIDKLLDYNEDEYNKLVKFIISYSTRKRPKWGIKTKQNKATF